MYQIVHTKGDEEKVIAEYADLEQARAEAKRLERLPEYAVGIVTVEQKTEKGTRIF